MTAREMNTLIGKVGTLTATTGLYVNVTIINVRKVFDRVDYLIEPVAGSGNAWVSAARISAVAP